MLAEEADAMEDASGLEEEYSRVSGEGGGWARHEAGLRLPAAAMTASNTDPTGLPGLFFLVECPARLSKASLIQRRNPLLRDHDGES